jgi:S1-C subfamily serine protease
MLRALVLATLFLVMPRAGAVQALSVLHIKVVLVDAERKATPVPHHALLISDNPASRPPRRVVTTSDGTADVRLPPGNYTVESDRPVALEGKAYQWVKTIDIVAGRDVVLELTADNADVEPITGGTTTAAPLEADPLSLLSQWQDSVVAVWSPTARASGFFVNANGIVATNQQVVGAATSVEVQLTPAVKVAASVLAADAERDVAILWIDPKVAASVRPVPLGCQQAAKPRVVDGQEIFTIGSPLRDQKGMTPGTVERVEPHAILSDLRLPPGSTGGPVFTADGGVVGLTSPVDERNDFRRGNSRIVRVDDVCDLVTAAEKKMKDTAPPNAAHLPVEPVRPFPVDTLKDAMQHRAGSLRPYQMSSSDFDVAFITPVMIYAAQDQSDRANGRERGRGTRPPDAEQTLMNPLMEFGNWSEYIADYPAVLLVRVTPRLVEGFWTTVARGAARTQGVSVPPIKHFKSGFSRMRAFCGDREVTPIHSFKLEQRLPDGNAIYEGLYVFDPGALGPQCGSVKLVLFSEKEPEKADGRLVDPNLVQQIWQDFEPYRALKPDPNARLQPLSATFGR